MGWDGVAALFPRCWWSSWWKSDNALTHNIGSGCMPCAAHDMTWVKTPHGAWLPTPCGSKGGQLIANRPGACAVTPRPPTPGQLLASCVGGTTPASLHARGTTHPEPVLSSPSAPHRASDDVHAL